MREPVGMPGPNFYIAFSDIRSIGVIYKNLNEQEVKYRIDRRVALR